MDCGCEDSGCFVLVCFCSGFVGLVVVIGWLGFGFVVEWVLVFGRRGAPCWGFCVWCAVWAVWCCAVLGVLLLFFGWVDDW